MRDTPQHKQNCQLPVDVTQPEEIESLSLSIIDQEVAEPRPFAGTAWSIVRRMIHTTADFELLQLTRIHPQAIESGLQALKSGCTIFTDTAMALAAIPTRRLEPLKCSSLCLMHEPEIISRAKVNKTTRAHEAMLKLSSKMKGNVVVIGNAPTALLCLLDQVKNGAAPPALVVGMPVGFVNAAESKELLMQQQDIPYISISGRKGGSAVAGSVVNALADIALAQQA